MLSIVLLTIAPKADGSLMVFMTNCPVSIREKA